MTLKSGCKFFATLLLLCSSLIINAQIDLYNFPTTSTLASDSKYDIRVRTYNPTDKTFGEWKEIVEMVSIPRNYSTHWKLADDAMLDAMKDRTLTFGMFAFKGEIEVEVKQKLTTSNAYKVEIAPKNFGIVPHYFDGKIVRFRLTKPEYISVNFDFGVADRSINGDDDGYGGKNIKNGCVVLTDGLESESGYTIPNPSDPGVVVWSNETPLATIRAANIIYFPAGETNMKDHPGRWELDGKTDIANATGNWVQTKVQYDAAPLYRGRLKLGKSGQKVYLAPGAIVYGGFHGEEVSNTWIYGRGIVSGRKHLMHEIVRPLDTETIGLTQAYNQLTETKRAFCPMGNGANFQGVLMLEPWHHTCPSGSSSVIKDLKIIGWCFNNDGIRPASNSTVNRVFIKTNDDYDYSRDPHKVYNGVFWPGNNCGVGMLGWGDLGSGYAEYYNCNLINAEWNRTTVAEKGNVGLISGGKANVGIKLTNNIYQDINFENQINFFSAVLIEETAATVGYLKNFKIKNITTEYQFQTPNGTKVLQEMTGKNNTWVEGWTYTNFIVDGVLVTWDNYKDYFKLNLTGTNGTNTDATNVCKNITFNTEGDLYKITYTSSGSGILRPIGKNKIIQTIGSKNQMVSINPQQGNRIESIRVDGNLIYQYGSDVYNRRYPSVVFENINSDHTIDVVFASGADTFDMPVIEKGFVISSNKELYKTQIGIFPNPVKDKFNIDFQGRYKIFTIDGKLMVEDYCTDNQVNVSGFNNGFYILSTEKGNFRFVKE